jgi:hypothetical protein
MMPALRKSGAFRSLFFQIFALRAKIWKNKSVITLLPQANLADDYATAYVL